MPRRKKAPANIVTEPLPDNRPTLYLVYGDETDEEITSESDKTVTHNISIRSFSDRYLYPHSVETVQNGELGDHGFAVVVTYNDGDTFTSHLGLIACASISPTREMAEAEKALVVSGAHPRRNDWTGYFASTSSVDTVPVSRN